MIPKGRLFFILIIFLSIPPAFCQTGLQTGDVTGDGVIDGRDALRIMRSIEGLDSLGELDSTYADVYPLGGDGQLTVDDVNKILRYSVGLTPESEMTGEIGNAQPVITDFTPHSGPIGTQVTISGIYFLSETQGENMVFFGNVLASVIEANATTIVAQVPSEAQTSAIRVITPSGEAVSPDEFSITNPSQGLLVLDGNLNPSDFTIINGYEEIDEVGEDGAFQIASSNTNLTMVAAVPKEDGNHTYMSLWFPIDNTSPAKVRAAAEGPKVIDAYTTAKSLVFLCPLFTNLDKAAAKVLFETMEGVPEVTALAQTISQRYPQRVEGLDDPTVEEAWIAACVAVNNALPENLLIDLSESSTPAKTSGRSMQTAYNLPTSRTFSLLPMAEVWENSLTIRGVDRHYTGAEYKKYSGVKANLEGYCPLDWIVVIEELDMADLPRGINEPFYDLVQRNIGVKRIVNSTVLPANLWTAKIDLLYTAIDSVMTSFLDEYLPQNPYMKLGTKEGVYLINAYSGVIRSSQEYAKRDYDVIGLKDKRVNAHRTAALTNLMLTAIDAWSLFSPDDEPISHAALRAAIQNGSRKLSSELGGQLYSQTDLKKVVRILWNVMVEAYKQVTVNAVAEAGKEASKKLSSTIGKAGSKVFAVLAVLDKISTVGRMTERLLGLAGKATNGYSLLDGPTPLESIVVVVGDPFSPSISKIEPNTIWEGLSVTLTGKNFDPKPENNTIAFAAIDALEGETRQGAKVLSVVQKDDSQELTLEVPHLIDNTLYRIYIDTLAGMKTVRSSNVVHYLSIPQLEAISPQVGFATPVVGDDNPLQGSSFNGTKVSLITKNYYDSPAYSKTILFGGEEVEILPDPLIENPPGVLSVWTPPLSSGSHDVFIQTRRSETDYQSNKKTFTLLSEAVLKEVSPTKARYGTYVTLTGDNFGTDASIVFVQIDDRIISPYTLSNTRLVFLMPELQEKGQRQLSVWTPSGRSNFLEIEALEGLDTTPPPSLPEGYEMTVTTEESGQNADGKLSLDEAAAVARGELDLWGGGGWDDTDRELLHIFNQQSDGTWVQGTDSYVSLDTSGPGHETLYVYNIYNHNNGNREKVLDYTTSSDSGSEIEEGDLVTGTKGQGGRNFSDSITSQKGLEIRAVNVALGPDDGLDLLRNNSVLHLGGRGINASGQARILLATVDATQCGAESALTLSSGAHSSITGRFENAPQNAVTLADSSHCTIEVTAKNNGGSAVLINKGELNRIYGSVHAGGKGVSIDGGNHNYVDSMYFANVTNPLSLNNCKYNEIHGFVCSATRGDIGIKLSGSSFNNITDGELSGFANAAVQVSNSKQNLLRDLTIDGNEGDGLIIDKGSEANIVDRITCTKNRNGVVLMGAGTRLNQLTKIQSGDDRWSYWDYDDNPVDPSSQETQGNQQYGLHIKEGATENQIEECDFWGNGKHGVLIEGNSTALNVLKDCNLMSDYVSTRGNAEDGLRIENGANYNTIEECRFSHNGGNGATIRGEGTNFNKLYKCTFGHAVTEYNDSEDGQRIPHHTLFPNTQWGASIEDFAYQNQIVECIFAANGLGGLRLHQLAAADEDEYSALVRDSCFGYKRFVEAMTSVHEKNIWRLWDASGPAVLMDTVVKAKLDTNFIYSHDIGVQMKLSHECTLTDTYSHYNKNSGVVLDQSSNNTIESAYISQTANDAIALNETESNTFIGGVVSDVTGNAIVINHSKADLFKQHQVYGAQGDGISIHASENLHLIECDYQEINGDAMIIDEGSKNVTLDRLDFANNYKSGIILKEVSDIYMIGERPREGFWVFGHPEVGIRVENSQRIHIGYEGKGINLPGNRGILVTGDQTQDVWITSSIVYDDPFTMSEYAICVENGQNIVIGGWAENERNNIEFNNQDGILITGGKARVTVINNLIGEPEEWESGDGSYGNIVGVHLTNGANNCTVAQNLINANQSYGVLIDGGAHDNAVHQNQITENGDCGVFVEGGASIQNKISKNFFRQNLGAEILLLNGGNTEIAPPTVDRITWQGDNISGTCNAPKGSRIEMYAGNEVNGYKHIDDSQLYGNNFYGSGYLANNEYVKAIVIDPVGNTSTFGNAKSVDSGKDDLGFQTYAFNASLNGNEDVYIQRTSETKALQLTTDPAADFDPIFSPNGEQILFVSDRDGNKDLWIANADGSELQSVISNPAADYDPVWLSDNGQIVYVSERDGNPELFLDSISSGGGGGLYYGDFFTQAFQKREGDGGGVQFNTTAGSTLTKFSVYLFKSNYQFNWKVLEFDGTPTLNAIAEGQVDPSIQGTPDDFEGWFEVDIDDIEVPKTFTIAVFFTKNYIPPFGNSYSVEPGYGFWKYESGEWSHLPNGMLMIQAHLGGAESGPVRLTDHDGTDRYPSPSPDGKRIAFSSDRSGNMDVWMLDIESGDLTQLTNDPSDDVQPAWSPNGEQIAFVSNRDGSENIYLLDVATKSSSRLTEDPARDLDPIWSGSGDSILFASDRDAGMEIYALAVGASKPERLTLMTGDCRNPSAMSVVESYDDSAKIARRTSASISINPMQAQSHITLPTLEAKPGDRVALDVTVQNGSPVGNLAFDIDYDRSALRLVQIEKQETLPMTAYALAPENFSESTAWPVRYNGIHSTGLTESGKIVTLHFDVKEIVSSKNSFVNFSNVQTYDVSLNGVPLESKNGTVKITVDQTNVQSWMIY